LIISYPTARVLRYAGAPALLDWGGRPLFGVIHLSTEDRIRRWRDAEGYTVLRPRKFHGGTERLGFAERNDALETTIYGMDIDTSAAL
jgi:hypothetical protein